MKKQLERRYRRQEFRVEGDGPATKISGYGAVFDSESEDLGWFRETIDPHAFDNVMASNPDVRALWNHDSNIVLGRTTAGTLRLAIDARGLSYQIDPPDTQAARDLIVSMRRKDVTQSSFGFIVKRDQWTDEEDGSISRRILEIEELFDVSPVTFPAYSSSAAQLSSLPRSMPKEMRAKVLKRAGEDEPDGDECICACSQCMDGDCANCSNSDCDDENCRCQYSQAGLRAKRRLTHTKSVDGHNLTSDCFIIVGDPEKTDTWHLPWKFPSEDDTKSHLRDALARFDQLQGVSDEEKKAAWTKLVGLCKEHGIEVSEDDSREWKKGARERLQAAVAKLTTPGVVMIFVLAIFCGVAGCGGPYHVAVYGRSGAAFTAPSLCGALVACLNSSETSCFYDRTLMQTATGQTQSEECKEVKK